MPTESGEESTSFLPMSARDPRAKKCVRALAAEMDRSGLCLTCIKHGFFPSSQDR